MNELITKLDKVLIKPATLPERTLSVLNGLSCIMPPVFSEKALLRLMEKTQLKILLEDRLILKRHKKLGGYIIHPSLIRIKELINIKNEIEFEYKDNCCVYDIKTKVVGKLIKKKTKLISVKATTKYKHLSHLEYFLEKTNIFKKLIEADPIFNGFLEIVV